MTESQFNDWKESSDFFFNRLRTSFDEYGERMQGIGVQLADCDPADIPKIHKLATVIGAQAEMLNNTIHIDYDDIFGGDDD
jgi:DNA-binding ferritin-like protein